MGCHSLEGIMARRFVGFLFFCLSFFLMFFPAVACRAGAQTSLKYQEPPRAIIDLVDARLTPNVEISPGDGLNGRWLLIEAI